MKEIIIGSRGSDLALWQAHFVKGELEKLGHNVSIKIIKTQGDQIQHLSFDKLEGKGFFTKEIETELLSGAVDLAVHSHKDLETNPPSGLMIGAVSDRANPSDILLIRKEVTDPAKKWSLNEGAVVGTSSARRKSQVLAYRPDIELKDLRGNVPTRINKLREGQYDAILLAKAGVDRLELDLSDFTVIVLDPSEFVPAPAQGVLGLQIRENDDVMSGILNNLNNKVVQQRIGLERKVLNMLEGGCQLPLGVYCNENDELYVSFAKTFDAERVYLKYDVDDYQHFANKVIEDIKSHVVEL